MLDEWVAIGVAFLALVVAGLSWLEHRNHGKRIWELEKAREEDRRREARSANLVPTIERDHASGRPQDWLFIVNEGRAEARNVRGAINGKPLPEVHWVSMRHPEIAVIGPSAEYRIPLSMELGARERGWVLELTWEDDSGEPGRLRTQLG